MWYCTDCEIEITKAKKNRHLKTGRHQKSIGNNPYHCSNIYKIVCLNTDNIYIGSTILPIKERLKGHKRAMKQYQENKSYSRKCASFIVLNNCNIELIEQYKCESENELKIREQHHIENNECVNYNRAKGIGINASQKEYREKNKDKIRAKKSQYREKNKEKIRAHKSKKVTCECGVTYAYDHASRHKRSKQHIEQIMKRNK